VEPLSERSQRPNVYVSAASRGIGFGVARRLARDAGRLAICSRSDRVEQAAAQLRAENPSLDVVPLRADLSTAAGQESVLAALADAGFKPDIFVCNAGHPARANLEELTREQAAECFELILNQAVFATQRFAPAMAARGYGRLIYMASVHAKIPNSLPPEFVLTSLARASLFALAKAVQQFYVDRGVCAFPIALGYVDTPMLRNAAAGLPIDDDPPSAGVGPTPWGATYDEWANSLPARRIASVEELAELVAFLTSPAADYLNGQVLNFSGGLDGCIL